MNAAQALAGLWLLSLVAVAGIIVGHIVSERRTARRTRAYEAGRDAAVAARRDADWRALKAEWLGVDFDTAPVLNHDPEVLGS